MKKGFTLVEILITMVIIGILVAIIIPTHKSAVLKAKEAVLKENLFLLRDAINKYYFDKKKYPTSLEDLVATKYLREVPMDPILKKRVWGLVHFEQEDFADFDPEKSEEIVDIKSLAPGTASDGTKYEDW
jgi:general secretion pathway protein G